MRRPRLIGIGGPSGSGKSTLAARLGAALPGGGVIVSRDSYYRPLDHLSPSERAECNLDHPDALDWDLLLAQLAGLCDGQLIEEPIYRFDLHTLDPQTRKICPGSVVIVEGILALHREAVRAVLDLKVYIETREKRSATGDGWSATPVNAAGPGIQWNGSIGPQCGRWRRPSSGPRDGMRIWWFPASAAAKSRFRRCWNSSIACQLWRNEPPQNAFRFWPERIEIDAGQRTILEVHQ